VKLAKGIGSIETGFRVLRALEVAAHPLTLTQIAQASGISASNARFYLVSLIRTGAVAQTSAGGRYRLGPAAMRMGLAAMSQNDAIEIARDRLEALSDATGESVFLSVWGEFGPVVVNRVDGGRTGPFAIRVGSRATLLDTATGKVCLSYLPESETRELLKKSPSVRERRSRPQLVGTRVEDIVAEVRSHGFARSSGTLPGVEAIAAPVFGINGLECVITVVGHEIDMRAGSLPVRSLLEMARGVSHDAGFSGELPATRRAARERGKRAV
jgi:DNA-binding IclR family transcriptional regulator